MKVIEETTIHLEQHEVIEIIKKYLTQQGYDVKNIKFEMSNEKKHYPPSSMDAFMDVDNSYTVKVLKTECKATRLPGFNK